MSVKRFASLAAMTILLVVAVSAGAPDPVQGRRVQNTGGAAPASSPRLVVVIVLDQVRADYLDRFADDWTGGLKRMMTTGAWFTRAAYPYLITATCAGHATVSSGALPRTHGVVHNEWFDRQQQQLVTCTADSSVHNIAYGAQATGGDSAAALRVPALADQMRSQRSARVVTLSIKERSAIMLAGHGPATTVWRTGMAWVTSSAFAPGPVHDVESLIASHPVENDFSQVWERLLPPNRYRGPDDGLGEVPPRGWTPTFPHDLKDGSTRPDAGFEARWERSPFADAYLGRLAADLVERLRLGRGNGIDFLGVSFSGPDRVGHQFGPDSQEIQDLMLRLDRTLGALFDRLDASVGRDGYVVALTADHGVTPIPAQLAARGESAGTLEASAIVARVEPILAEAFGPGKHVAWLDGLNLNLYFARGVYEKLQASKPVLDRVLQAMNGVAGVRTVFRREELLDGESSRDPLLRATALGFDKERSGDLIVVLKPGWSAFRQLAAVHWNTGSLDDRAVPLLFMGPQVRPGRYERPATPADVAPTLAHVAGVTLPRVEGRVLSEALSPERAGSSGSRTAKP